MTLRRKSKIWRWALMGVAFAIQAAPALGSLGASATDPKGRTSAPKPADRAETASAVRLTAESCEKRKQLMTKETLRILKLDDARLMDQLTTKDLQTRVKMRKCPMNSRSGMNAAMGDPCSKIYVTTMNANGAAYKLVSEGCGLVAKAAEKSSKCDSGTAGCGNESAALYNQAADKLLAAEKVLLDGEAKLKPLREAASSVVINYSGHLRNLASVAKALGQEASPDHPALVALSKKATGGTTREFLELTGATDLDPAALTRESQKIQAELVRSSQPGYVPGEGDTRWPQPRELLTANWTSSEAISYARQEAGHLETTRTQLADAAEKIKRVSNSLASLPPTGNSPVNSGAPTGTRPAGSAPVDIGPRPGTNQSTFNSSTASRAPASTDSPSPEAFSMPSFGPMGGSGPAGAPQAGMGNNLPARPQGPYGVSSGAITSVRANHPLNPKESPARTYKGEEAPNADRGDLSLSREMGSTPTAAYVAPPARNSPQIAARPGISSEENGLPLPTVKARFSPESLQATLGTNAPTSLSPSSIPAPPLTPETKRELNRVVDAEIAKVEKQKPLGRSLRESLRNRLYGQLERETRKAMASAEAAKASGSNPTVKSLIQTVESSDALTAENFQLSGAETDAVVQRLVDAGSGLSEELSSAGSDAGASLFARVSGAYARMIRAGTLSR